MRRRWLLVALIVIAAGSLAGYALASSEPARRSARLSDGRTAYAPLRTASHTAREPRSYPITSLWPGKLTLARLRLRGGAPYSIYGQRIGFQHRLYFCLSAGNPSSSFQTCPPWPLARGKTDLLLGGGPPLVELALAINPPSQTCTFVGIPGGPYRASQVPMPAALKVRGALFFAFVKRPRGDGVPRLAQRATSVQFLIGDSARARCRPREQP